MLVWEAFQHLPGHQWMGNCPLARLAEAKHYLSLQAQLHGSWLRVHVKNTLVAYRAGFKLPLSPPPPPPPPAPARAGVLHSGAGRVSARL